MSAGGGETNCRCASPVSSSGRRGPAPEARQKIGPGVSPASPIPPRPKPQRGDRFQPPLLRCPIGSCRRHKTAATHSRGDQQMRSPFSAPLRLCAETSFCRRKDGFAQRRGGAEDHGILPGRFFAPIFSRTFPVVRGTGVISPEAAKPQSRERQGSNGAVSRPRWRHEDCDPQSLFLCHVARTPAPELRQKIGPGVSPGSAIPPGPEPQRGDRIHTPLLRCRIGSCGRHPTRPPRFVSRRDQRKRSPFSAPPRLCANTMHCWREGTGRGDRGVGTERTTVAVLLRGFVALRELRLDLYGRVSGVATTAMRLDPGLAWDPGLSSCLGPTLLGDRTPLALGWCGVQRQLFLRWGKPMVALQKSLGGAGSVAPLGLGFLNPRPPTTHAVGYRLSALRARSRGAEIR